MLAKAVADMSRSTFFSCSGASLISKYRGESEKIVQCLFECARICASQSPSPSIIFLDEVDAFVSSRSSDQEHEASRRLKTEFFAQMDGIASAVSAARVMVLSTTNCPWDLDPAILRRLEKRLLVPLPDQSARTEQFHKTLRSLNGSNVIEGGGISEAEVDSNMQSLAMAYAELTEGYSGADIHVICREASMGPIRRMLSGSNLQQILQKKQSGEDLETPHILRVDFIDAIRNTRPTVSPGAQQKYNDWNDKFGST